MPELSDSEFNRVADLMHRQTGVFLKPSKKTLVYSRLRKRIEELSFSSFSDYIKLLEKPDSEELEGFINAITTNETYFFRHAVQFNYLYEVILPEFRSSGRTSFGIWSAASSTGEEVFSIAIALAEFYKGTVPTGVRLHASDVNTQVIEQAKKGWYPVRSVRETPDTLIRKYFREVPPQRNGQFVELSAAIRSKVEFFQHNLQKPAPMKDLDVVFLRNVMIYFDQPVKQNVVSQIERAVKPGGYLFISLSENLNDVKSSFKLIESGMFRKAG